MRAAQRSGNVSAHSVADGARRAGFTRAARFAAIVAVWGSAFRAAIRGWRKCPAKQIIRAALRDRVYVLVAVNTAGALILPGHLVWI